MANTFVSYAAYLTGLNRVNLYTCPSTKKTIIRSLSITNADSASGVTITWNDSHLVTTGSTGIRLLSSGIVPGSGKLRVLDDFLVIRGNDTINVYADQANKFNIILSAIESTDS